MSDQAPTREEVIQCLENFTQLLRDVPEIEPTYVRRMSSSDGTVVIEVEAKGPGISEVDLDDPEEAIAFLCKHCRRVLPMDLHADEIKELSDRSAQWCVTCAYITHPDGEGEEACDGACAVRAEALRSI